MNFYFCEKCGKRINDDEVRNKGLKGWYCSDCAVGVMTMEMSAVSEKQARALIEKEKAQQPAPPTDALPEQIPVRSKPRSSRSNIPVRPSGLAPAVPPPTRIVKRESAPAPAVASPRDNSQALVIGSVAAVLVLLIAFAVLRDPKKPALESGPTPLAAQPAQGTGPGNETTQPITATKKPLVAGKRDPNAAGEAEAERAFDELKKKLAALGNDKEKKIAAAEDYLEKYNEFIVAARVRNILDGIVNPQAQQAESDRHGNTGRQLEEQKKALLQRLKETNPDFDGTSEIIGNSNQITGLRLDKKPISDLSALKGLSLRALYLNDTDVTDLSVVQSFTMLQRLEFSRTGVSDLSPLKGLPLVGLYMIDTKVKDLSPLKGMPLLNLDVSHTGVTDLSPLKGMPLTSLTASGTQVSDLTPLKGMKLESLVLERCPVENLSPLAGMPLTKLGVRLTKVTDLTPLKGMPLKVLGCNFVPKRDAEFLKSITTLEKLNNKPPQELLKGKK